MSVNPLSSLNVCSSQGFYWYFPEDLASHVINECLPVRVFPATKI